MKRETITLVGRASKLAFADGTATWTIAVRRADRHTLDSFNFKSFHSSVNSESRALGRVVTLSGPSDWKGLYDERYLDIRDNAVLELRRLQCRRPVPPVYPETRWASTLQKAHAGCRIVDGLCPHRGIPIACGRQLAPGVRQCPGHGLAWDQDGRQVQMVAPGPVVASGATT